MPLFRIALHTPKIPNNTGNIGRTCIATGCSLDLIRPLAFDTSEKACRRAGLDYWPRLAPREHDSLEQFLATLTREPVAGSKSPPRLWAFSTKARRSIYDAQLSIGDTLLFGNETEGLPAEVLARFEPTLLTLPMLPSERSLNLATAVCAAIYVGVGRLLTAGELTLDEQARLKL